MTFLDGTRFEGVADGQSKTLSGVMTGPDGTRYEGTIQAGNLLENFERELRSAGLITD